MGKAARLKRQRREQRQFDKFDRLVENEDWLGVARHFERTGMEVLDDKRQPIKFDTIEDGAAFWEKRIKESRSKNNLNTEKVDRLMAELGYE